MALSTPLMESPEDSMACLMTEHALRRRQNP